MMYETQVTLRVDIISNISWKEQLSQQVAIKETWFELLYSKDDLAGQIKENNIKNSFEHVF